MDSLEIKGHWNVLKGKLKQKYNQLTDDDLEFDGNKDELLGKLEIKLAKTKDKIEEEFDELMNPKKDYDEENNQK